MRSRAAIMPRSDPWRGPRKRTLQWRLRKFSGLLAVMGDETSGATGPPPSGRLIPRSRRSERIAAVVLVVTALAIAGQFAWRQHHSPTPAPGPASAPGPA